MNLFCLPYAGGSASIYYKWRRYLRLPIKLYPIELTGRGKRFNENFYEDVNEAVEDIYNIINREIDNCDYAIYGHSMGSLLAYELYYKIDEMKKRTPKHIFFSGYNAPNIKVNREAFYNLPNNELIKKIVDLGGTPKELINNKELADIVLPIIINDMKILDKYKYKERYKKIQCSISVLNGNKDALISDEIASWRKHTSRECKLYTLSGNHFFINENIENITNIINHTLLAN